MKQILLYAGAALLAGTNLASCAPKAHSSEDIQAFLVDYYADHLATGDGIVFQSVDEIDCSPYESDEGEPRRWYRCSYWVSYSKGGADILEFALGFIRQNGDDLIAPTTPLCVEQDQIFGDLFSDPKNAPEGWSFVGVEKPTVTSGKHAGVALHCVGNNQAHLVFKTASGRQEQVMKSIEWTSEGLSHTYRFLNPPEKAPFANLLSHTELGYSIERLPLKRYGENPSFGGNSTCKAPNAEGTRRCHGEITFESVEKTFDKRQQRNTDNWLWKTGQFREDNTSRCGFVDEVTETKLCTIEFDVKPEGLIWLVDHHDVRDCKVTDKRVTKSSKAPCP